MTQSNSFSLEFPWPLLRAIVAGESAIDVPRLSLSSLADAESFLECYGYNWDKKDHQFELESLRKEAWGLIEEELTADILLEPPADIRFETDIRKILVFASESSSLTRQQWACALLRVMHTFAHCRSYFNERFSDSIRNQILTRFEPHLTLTLNGLVLGPPPGIALTEFEVKPVKPARSVVMKLLQKPENVAADIFDRVGVRFVTRERFDALLVVRFLRANNIVMFANIKPSRSRNTLIDVDAVATDMAYARTQVDSGVWTPEQSLHWIRMQVQTRDYPAPAEPSANPFSAIAYHSIQFTCRQLIREIQHGEEVAFFFPYEVQVLDEESYLESRSGFASHEHYKARQREVVKHRVLRGLV